MPDILYMMSMNPSPLLGVAHILMKETINKQIIFKVLVNPMRKIKSKGVRRICVTSYHLRF